jgi:NitT/TauT family transport system substrate-binding protein
MHFVPARARRQGWLGLAVGAGFLLSACGGTASKASAPATTASRPPLANVTLRLDWTPSGYHAPIIYGIDQGIYRRYGINLKVEAGNGSVSTIETTAEGQQQFGLADGGTMTALAAKGVPIEMVLGYFQEAPNAVLVPSQSGIKTPQQLAGKALAATALSSATQLFPGFAKAVGLAPTSVHVVDMSSSARVGSIVSHQTVGELAWTVTDVPLFLAQHLTPTVFLYAHYGLNLEGDGFIAAPSLVKQNPQLVARFVAATQASLLAAQHHPQAAIRDLVAYFGSASTPSPTVLLQQFKLGYQLVRTPNDRGHPLGWMAPQDWANTVKLAQQYLGVKQTIDPGALYTDRFVPEAG